MVEWPRILEMSPGRTTISDSDPEEGKVRSLATKVEPFANLTERLIYFSYWDKTRRVIALLIRLQKRYKGNQGNELDDRNVVKEKKGLKTTELISVEEIYEAEFQIIRAVQKEAFPREVKLLQPGLTTQERTEERSVKKANAISN